uniref:Uncharacterized protein n=1 Tax=Globisporangium ultimum (strain ATCC 200006 / CBS 805.95 / DAOM BR144) TaxID=431595 RepID=K3WE83_GLOUD
MTMSDMKTITRILFGKSDLQSLKDRMLLNHQWSAIGQWMGLYSLVRMICMKINPVHSLACQLAGDPFNVSDLLFSQINDAAKEEDKVAAYINSLLRKLSDLELDSLTKGLKSQSSRRGLIKCILKSERCRPPGALFECIAEASSSDQKVARVLTGWGDPLHNVHPPRLHSDQDTAGS